MSNIWLSREVEFQDYWYHSRTVRWNWSFFLLTTWTSFKFIYSQYWSLYFKYTNSVDTQIESELELQSTPRVPSIFEHGFFEVHVRLENRVIKANCLTCQRMGRANLIQAREYSSSNLLAHLKVSANWCYRSEGDLLNKNTRIKVDLGTDTFAAFHMKAESLRKRLFR